MTVGEVGVNAALVGHYGVPVALATDEVTLWRQPEVAIDVDSYLTEQVFFESRDGTRVPMVITRHRARDARLARNADELRARRAGLAPATTGARGPSLPPAAAAALERARQRARGDAN